MKTVTFYSFRGGVGRSMALANIAYLLAESRERRILIVDFDIEAPGVSLMPQFQPEVMAPKGGLVDFLASYQNGESPRLADYIVSIPAFDNYISILVASDITKPVAGAERVDIISLLTQGGSQLPFPQYFRQQAESLGFHYVLLDSRTGLTESGGLCTVALADLVIILTGLNKQNLEGTKWVLNNVRRIRSDENRALVVFSHVPESEEELKQLRINEAKKQLGLPEKEHVVMLSYHPRLSLKEELFVQSWPDKQLSVSYRHLMSLIVNWNSEDLEGLVLRLRRIQERLGPTADTKQERKEFSRITDEVRKVTELLYPQSPRINRQLGRVLFALGNYPLAFEHLQRAISTSVFVPNDYRLILKCVTELGDMPELQRIVQRLLDVSSKMPLAERQELLEIFPSVPRDHAQKEAGKRPWQELMLRAQLTVAESYIREQTSPTKESADVFNSASVAHLLLYYFDRDKSHLRKAVDYSSSMVSMTEGSDGHYNLGCAYALSGNREAALTELRKVPILELTTSEPDKDRDWESLWRDDEFREILRSAKGPGRKRRKSR